MTKASRDTPPKKRKREKGNRKTEKEKKRERERERERGKGKDENRCSQLCASVQGHTKERGIPECYIKVSPKKDKERRGG